MPSSDLVEMMRRELAPPPVDLSSLEARVEGLTELLEGLVRSVQPGEERLQDLKEVAARVGYGRTAFLELYECDPSFPRAVEMPGRGVKLLWLASDVDKWIRERPRRARRAS